MNNDMKTIKDMRKNIDAPVDTFGCHLFEDKSIEPNISNFQVSVAAFLSSQTKGIILFPVKQHLKEKGLTVDNILKLHPEELAAFIKPIGFQNKRAKIFQKICIILKEAYNYQIPKSYNNLIKLPGIGPILWLT